MNNKNKVGGFIMLTGVLLLSGCLSYTCSTVKCSTLSSPPPGIRYFVRSFSLSPVATVYPFGSYPENKMNGNARAERIRAAFAQHSPDLFSDRPEGAVPIDVNVDVVHTSKSGTDGLTAFLCGFTYGILPGRLSNNLNVTVTVKLSGKFAVYGSSQTYAFDDRAEYNLMFYSPINLILAPVSEKFNGCRGFGGDTYDWYPTKELGSLVRSALARFDQHKLKEALEAKPQVVAEQPKAVPPAPKPMVPSRPVPPQPEASSTSAISAEDIPL